jgi:hypothetical protein
MRKLLLPCLLLLLAAPAVALAGRSVPGDGTLSVKDGKGVVVITARGTLIMRCGKCDVIIDDPNTTDGTGAIWFGADVVRVVTETSTLYRNKDKSDMRIRLVGGFFRATIKGADINVSAVGKGNVVLLADKGDDVGTFALDDGPVLPLPAQRQKFPLGTTG